MTHAAYRRINRHDEGDAIIARLLACLPAATLEMETFCRLAGIKTTRDIPTAAVEVAYRPRLLLNPDFIAKHCERDEHLFLLVMHELWHIILAHTRLYPRPTMAHNIAFDAIINAALTRQYHAPEYRGFFESINQADQFPGSLLRAPEGYPYNPQYPPDDPPGLRQILMRLYPPLGQSQRISKPLYREILDLLQDYVREMIAQGKLIVEPVLLGDHDNDGSGDGDVLDDPLMREAVRRIANSLPRSLMQSGERGDGMNVNDRYSAVAAATEDARRAFSRVLQRCLGPRYGTQRRRARTAIPGMSGISVIPNARDRHAAARQALGVQGVLWGQPGIVKARVPETPSRSYVYLDVSGSMNNWLPALLGLLIPYVTSGRASIYQFSTAVEKLNVDDLKRGKLRTTAGTDINAVLTHVFAAVPPVRSVLILTDGYTGKPLTDHIQTLRERHIRLYVVMPYESANPHDLRDLARAITILPPMRRSPLPGRS
jgi:hypothetical protein